MKTWNKQQQAKPKEGPTSGGSSMYYLLFVIVLIAMWGLVNMDISTITLDQHHIFNKKTFLDTTKKVFEDVSHNQLPFIPPPIDTSKEEQQEVSSSVVVSPKTSPPTTNARYAYVTLIHGIDETFRYRGYLYNVMIMKTALHSFGSEADLVVLIGYSKGAHKDIYQEDLDRLTSIGIKIVYLPRLRDVDEKEKVDFAEMALLVSRVIFDYVHLIV
jgi:hypothetical protein